MKTIQLTYSLEWFKSRLPSVYPSYDGDELLFFDEESIKKRDNRLMSNYGTVPLDICPKLLGYNGFDDNFKISWNTFSKWFHEFKLYYWLLNDGGSCKRVYSSATDFYDSEYKSSSTIQLPFGSDRSSYEELDKSFKERGGKVSTIFNSCEGKRNIVRCCDNGFFKWICDNIVPSFEIPSEYVGYWNTNRIYYPNVISWISWFEERKGYPSELNKCAESDDCCDCEEYIRRGGEKLLESLKTWFKETNSNILKIKGIIEKVIEEDDKKEDDKQKDLAKKIFPNFFAPHAFCKINVSSCFGKPSLQSILSEKYNTKTDFRHGSYDSTSNTSGGTVVDVDGVSMHFKDDSRPNGGSTFNEEYMEMEYDDSAFEEYLPMYANDNKSSFSVPSGDTSGITLGDNFPILHYGVDKDGVKKYGKSDADVIDKFSTKAKIERNGKYGWFLIDEELYEVSPIESVEMNGEKIPVFRENGTNTPYVIVGGRDVYAEYDFKSNSYSFSFNVNATFKRNPSQDSFDESGIRCISYNGVIKTFPSTSDTITFSLSNGDTADYNLIDGYSIVDDSIYYIYKGKVTSGDTLDEVAEDEATVSGDVITIKAKGDIKISKCNVIIGTTSSKLLGLRSFNVMTDDNGNMIEALNTTPTKDTYNYQPLEGSELEPLYQVGNVACVSAFSLSYEDYENNKKKNEPSPIRHVGDIISSMTFYYADANGDKILDTVKKVGGAIKSSLNAIQESTKKATEYKNNYPMEVISDNVYCEIVYNIGATIAYDKAKASYSISGDSGVEYTEIVEFEKVKTEYYLGNNSHSYPIYVYKLRQGDNPTASFTAPINVFDSGLTTTYSSIDGMDDYNGLDAYPTFQDAYNIGISSLPIVDSDVNIDRGNNAAFEKHLKIGEVTSLEALENYTNGYFKMMEN